MNRELIYLSVHYSLSHVGKFPGSVHAINDSAGIYEVLLSLEEVIQTLSSKKASFHAHAHDLGANCRIQS